MIKNIPNKYNSKLLREKIDLNFLKKYDFFYLPILLDWGYQCTVAIGNEG